MTPWQAQVPTGTATFRNCVRPGPRRGTPGTNTKREWAVSCYVALPTMVAPTWHIITGEYAPAHGGVAEYCRSVACPLTAAGTVLHVGAASTAARHTGDTVCCLY